MFQAKAAHLGAGKKYFSVVKSRKKIQLDPFRFPLPFSMPACLRPALLSNLLWIFTAALLLTSFSLHSQSHNENKGIWRLITASICMLFDLNGAKIQFFLLLFLEQAELASSS